MYSNTKPGWPAEPAHSASLPESTEAQASPSLAPIEPPPPPGDGGLIGLIVAVTFAVTAGLYGSTRLLKAVTELVTACRQ